MYMLQIYPKTKSIECRTLVDIHFWLLRHGIEHDKSLLKKKKNIPRLAEQLKMQGVRLA